MDSSSSTYSGSHPSLRAVFARSSSSVASGPCHFLCPDSNPYEIPAFSVSVNDRLRIESCLLCWVDEAAATSPHPFVRNVHVWRVGREFLPKTPDVFKSLCRVLTTRNAFPAYRQLRQEAPQPSDGAVTEFLRSLLCGLPAPATEKCENDLDEPDTGRDLRLALRLFVHPEWVTTRLSFKGLHVSFEKTCRPSRSGPRPFPPSSPS